MPSSGRRLPLAIAVVAASVLFGSASARSADNPPPRAATPPEGDQALRLATACTRLAVRLYSEGKYAQAQPLFEKALEIHRNVQGEEHPETAVACSNLAANLTAQGKYVETEPLFRKALEIQLKSLGEEHLDTAQGCYNLAVNLHFQGKYAEAQPLFQKASDVHRKVLGEEHPGTATSDGGLARNLDAQRKHAEALPLHRRVLDLRRRVLGEEHSGTAEGYGNLAACLQAQARYAEAQPLFQKALDIRRKALGEEHPDTATSYGRLAGNLEARGMHAEAQRLFQKALDIRRKALGEEHPATATSYNNLAENLRSQRKFSEAQPLYQKAFDIKRRSLGEEHFETAVCCNNLALNLHSQGKYAEAQPLYQKALDVLGRVAAENHADAALAYGNLASLFFDQGKHAEAQHFYRMSLDANRRVLGDEHPSTAQSSHNLALNLNAQGKHAEAQPLFETALDVRRRVLGSQHPETALSLNSLAANLHDQGKYLEAQPLFLSAFNILRKALGEEHPHTAAACNNLARNLNAQRKYAEAQPLFQRALEIRRRTLGDFHPDTAQAYHNLAANLHSQGNDSEAQSLIEKALDLCRQTRGVDHSATADSYVGLACNLYYQGKTAEARGILEQAIPAYESSRLSRAEGLDRSIEASFHPRSLLAALQADKSPESAWRNVELSLARGLLDQLAERPEDRLSQQERAERTTCRQELADLQPRILSLVSVQSRTDDETRQLDKLLAAQQRVSRRLSALSILASEREVAPASDIRAALTADTAIVVWVDAAREHWGCVVRSTGDPHWERLPGTGPLHSWTTADSELPQQLRTALRGNAEAKTVDALARRLHAQRIAPLAGHLDGVRTLFVAGVNEMAGIPVEVLTPDYMVSYVPSGTFLARLKDRPPPEGKRLLAVGDPEFGDAALRNGDWMELPGTRVEVSLVAKLASADSSGDPVSGGAIVLFDSDASETRLDALRNQGELARCRYLHFATHAQANNVRAFDAALILAQVGLPKNSLPRAGEPFHDGQLSAREVLEFWKLDAELVTLSACETAIGRPGGGDGMLGFAQAFLTAGSRSVCLSLWKVDDAATSLLMARFYQNLLGRRPGLDGPMPKANALHEARSWLRNLSSREALQLTDAAANGVVRRDRGKGETLTLALPVVEPATGDVKPFAHPRYWSAFILIGDPR